MHEGLKAGESQTEEGSSSRVAGKEVLEVADGAFRPTNKGSNNLDAVLGRVCL